MVTLHIRAPDTGNCFMHSERNGRLRSIQHGVYFRAYITECNDIELYIACNGQKDLATSCLSVN